MNNPFIDTHAHLNFKRFNKTREEMIRQAQNKGAVAIIVPGTDILLSQKAIEVASACTIAYAAVGIHPHHTYNVKQGISIQTDMEALEKLITHPKVVAVGEVGLDRHAYEQTKYPNYQISAAFIDAQKEYLVAQLHLARRYKKALILHNRETKQELLKILSCEWAEDMRFRTVFHCCEPDSELLSYAEDHNVFIGVDGDITYGGEKGEFIKRTPLELLVLETDSPFLLPEPLKTQRLYPNTPANIPLIAQCVASLKGIETEEVMQVTTQNAKRLFGI